jgi:hypothetical protein
VGSADEGQQVVLAHRRQRDAAGPAAPAAGAVPTVRLQRPKALRSRAASRELRAIGRGR